MSWLSSVLEHSVLPSPVQPSSRFPWPSACNPIAPLICSKAIIRAGSRYHGVFAPDSQHRALVSPAKRGNGNQAKPSDASQDQTPAEPRASMTSAWRLKRVFKIDIETCAVCASGTLRIIACIEDGALIDKILSYLDKKEHPQATSRLPPAFGRARPNPMTRSDLRPSR